MRAFARQDDDVAELTEAAMAIALSVVLGNLRLVELPNGGSVAFGILPLLVYGLVRGFRPAFIAGWIAGMAHAMFGGRIVHPGQFLLDYGLAYAALSFVAIGRTGSRARMRIGIVVAGLAHLAVFAASGVFFFGDYAPAGMPVLTYSLAYNASHVLPEVVIALIAVPVLVRAYARSNPLDAWRLGLDPRR